MDVKNFTSAIAQIAEEKGISPDKVIETIEMAIAAAYKKEIDLPLFCLATPTAVTEKRITALMEAGLTALQMGIETWSPDIRSLYKRTTDEDTTLKAANLLHDLCAHKVKLLYDVMVDCPYETQSDALKTLRLLQKIPYPYDLTVFSLVLYPGTELCGAISAKSVSVKSKGIFKYDKALRNVKPTDDGAHFAIEKWWE